ncbi:hypothetical protein [Rhizorhabdus argentea]|uniref:hypothetical protein n=1 Tax=Rhizorhabdus argentea TaxID=1387174 RepID=UPI0030ED8BE2
MDNQPLRLKVQATHICPICLEKDAIGGVGQGLTSAYFCARCGPFSITTSAEAMLRNVGQPMPYLSGWCRDQQLESREAIIDSQVVGQCKSSTVPSLRERAMRLLRWMVLLIDEEPSRDDLIVPDPSLYMGASYSTSDEQVNRLIRVLESIGFAERRSAGGGGAYRYTVVTAEGALAVDEIQRANSQSASGFVAMWFSDDTREAWENGIRPAIREAGYDPVRVDDIEHVGKIDDEIINQIRKARFVVADFTGHRGGVYFEAGYALGLDIPVIWTCHQRDLLQLHFDIRQYNCLVWTDPVELHKRLVQRIENVAGCGPRAPRHD